MVGNVGQFYAELVTYFNSPRLPTGVQQEDFMRLFKQDVSGFSDRVYELAAQKLRTRPGAKRFFPPNEVILGECQTVHRALAAAAVEDRPGKRDAWSPEAQREADGILQKNRMLTDMALDEGWILSLWFFVKEHARLPSQREIPELIRTSRRTATKRAHPVGSICRDCAIQRGARAVPDQISSYWQAICDFCEFEASCNSPADWNWPHAAGSPKWGALAKSAAPILAKFAREEQRLLELLRREAA